MGQVVQTLVNTVALCKLPRFTEKQADAVVFHSVNSTYSIGRQLSRGDSM